MVAVSLKNKTDGFRIVTALDDHLRTFQPGLELRDRAQLSGQPHFAERDQVDMEWGRLQLELATRGALGRVMRIADERLQIGDALLLLGPRDRLQLLDSDSDFLVLTPLGRKPPDTRRAPVAAAIMLGVVVSVLLGYAPISVAAVVGGSIMVLTGCLTMEEAYRFIEWKAVFLIAGMLPLGVALDTTGAASLVAEQVIGLLGPFGPYGVLFGLLSITFIATSIIPTAALVVLMVPIALQTSTGLGISPYPLMMGIAMAASSSFTSPISHPANVLVMGPGGYRFGDYWRMGLPLELLVILVAVPMILWVWPF